MDEKIKSVFMQYYHAISAPNEALEMRAFRAKPHDEALEWFGEQIRVYNDLKAARSFLSLLDNKILFPVDEYTPIEINTFIHDHEDDAAERFTSLADRITHHGGVVEHRDCRAKYGTIQHIATLPLGSGRVVYRVAWIERVDTKKEDTTP